MKRYPAGVAAGILVLGLVGFNVSPAMASEAELPACHSGDGNHWTYITPDANGYNGHKHHDADVFGLTEAECLAKNVVEEPPVDPMPFVVIGWPMPSWAGPTTPTWPQGVAAGLMPPLTADSATKNLSALDAALAEIEANLTCETSVQFQVDGNFDTQPVRDAIAGGSLYGPGNPAEALWGGGWGEAYKLVLLTGPDCVDPILVIPTDPGQKDKCAVADDHFGLPVNTENVTYARDELDIIATRIGGDGWGVLPTGWVDNGNGTATFPFTSVTWTAVNCDLPEDYDTYGEWTDGEYGCDDTTVSQTRQVWHTHYSNNEDGSVNEETTESEPEIGEPRILTPEEIAAKDAEEDCKLPPPPPSDKCGTATTLACTGDELVVYIRNGLTGSGILFLGLAALFLRKRIFV
jgi:hypothetical protein